MGSVGAIRTAGGINSVASSPEYQDGYSIERMIREPDVPVPAAMDYEGRDDATVETQMRGYRSAIGDPIRAMERARASIQRELEPYKDAKSARDLGIKQAMQDMVNSYNRAIERMYRIKRFSSRPELL